MSVAMFQENANKWFFVCVTNSGNIPLFHEKVISQDLLQKDYPNLSRTCKTKLYVNEIKLNWLNLIKKMLLGYNWGGTKPVSDRFKHKSKNKWAPL